MFNGKKIAAAFAIFGVGFAALSTGSAVQAEPVANSFSIVGSDTLEDVVNAIVNGTSITGSPVRVTQNGATLGSFDATGPVYVITKPNGVRFARPNGSGDGYMALSASMGGATGSSYVFNSATSLWTVPDDLKGINVQDQVDISRSSSKDPKASSCATATCIRSNNDPEGKIARIPFGRDAIALAFSPALASALRTAEGLSDTETPYMTVAQLSQVFGGCSTDAQKITVTNPFTSTTTDITVMPFIPQTGSGTRKDFLGNISVTDNVDYVAKGVTASGTAVPTLTAAQCIAVGQEHDATNAAFASGSTYKAVMPMSASRWIAMKNGGSYNKAGGAVLGAVGTSTTLVANKAVSPVLYNAANVNQYTANSAYYADTTWGRDVFLFVERARIYTQAQLTAQGITSGITSKYNAALAALLLGGNDTNKLANTDASYDSNVGSVKAAFGFLAPTTYTTIVFLKPYN